MTIEINTDLFELLYKKATKSFYDCIGAQENKFLKSEIDIPIKSIDLIESYVKITFPQGDFNHYDTEVILLLQANNKEIGKYIYIEDNTGKQIDDSLIFY